jgi:hypothetical protein
MILLSRRQDGNRLVEGVTDNSITRRIVLPRKHQILSFLNIAWTLTGEMRR